MRLGLVDTQTAPSGVHLLFTESKVLEASNTKLLSHDHWGPAPVDLVARPQFL